jgi:hypothetical protein
LKFVIAGDGHSEIHERACATALRSLGHQVEELYWAPRFRSVLGIGKDEFRSFNARLQNKLIEGPIVRRYNADLLALCEQTGPDVFLAYRGTHVLPSTLRNMRAKRVSINNDDPFSPGASALHWRRFRAGLPEYDTNFVYRHRNLDDYRAAGARNVHLLRSFYIPARNYPMDIPQEYDVVFAGHFEPDGRDAVLARVLDEGIDLRIFGPEWESSPLVNRIPMPEYLDGERYNRVLNASKIVLSFLSTLNRDTYTRRCFEVPASGAFLLSQYSDDLASLFEEGREIAFFRNAGELVEKIRYYLAHDEERRAIARAGHERVRKDGHDVTGRMRQMLEVLA